MQVGLFISESVMLSVDCRPLSSFHPGGQPQEESPKNATPGLNRTAVRKRAMKVRRGGKGRNLGYGEANE